MGIEWAMGEINTQQVNVPFTTMSDYYRSKGFSITNVRVGYKNLGIHDYREVEDTGEDTLFQKYPNAQRSERINNTNKYRYYDSATVDHLVVDLRRLETNEKD